jgi:hypothetical protein
MLYKLLISVLITKLDGEFGCPHKSDSGAGIVCDLAHRRPSHRLESQVCGQLSHSPFGDSTLFSRMGYAKSFHNTVSEAGNDEKGLKIGAGIHFQWAAGNGWDDQDGMGLSSTCR